MKHLRLFHTWQITCTHTTSEGVITKSSRVLTRSFLKTLLAIQALFFGVNAVSAHFTDQFTVFYRKVKKDFYFRELDFSPLSRSSRFPGTTKILNVFNYSSWILLNKYILLLKRLPLPNSQGSFSFSSLYVFSNCILRIVFKLWREHLLSNWNS